VLPEKCEAGHGEAMRVNMPDKKLDKAKSGRKGTVWNVSGEASAGILLP
jgi:hypothetical protein